MGLPSPYQSSSCQSYTSNRPGPCNSPCPHVLLAYGGRGHLSSLLEPDTQTYFSKIRQLSLEVPFCFCKSHRLIMEQESS